MSFYHFLEFFSLLEVNVDTLPYVGHSKYLVRIHCAAAVDKLFHELIIGNSKVPPPSQTGSGIHKEAHKYPARRIKNLVFCKISAVHLVNGGHHIVVVAEAFLSAVIIIDNSCTGGRDTAFSLILSLKLISFKFAGMVIEPESAALHKGNVGEAVVLGDLDKTVL